jgi:acid stress-induced BolA-like protein IbaG/YrbA
MMEPNAVKALIEKGMADAQVTVTGDGRHFDAVVVSAAFVGLPLIKRHKMVMATVQQEIASDQLHALTIKALTPDQI